MRIDVFSVNRKTVIAAIDAILTEKTVPQAKPGRHPDRRSDRAGPAYAR